MPHGQFWMCLWDVQILIMRPSSRSESKMSIILSKKVLKYLSKNISDFKKKIITIFGCLLIWWRILPYSVKPSLYGAGNLQKLWWFLFLKSGIFFDKHFKIFLERIMDILGSLQDDSLIVSICTSHRHIQNCPWGTF